MGPVGSVANRIRIVMAEIPRMTRDIVRETVANEPDMILVGEYSERAAFLESLAADGADVVIFGTSEPGDSALPRQFFLTSPHIKVLMLAISGRSAVMYELRPHTTTLGDVSPQRLLEAIRSHPRSLASC
jgi:DNA-binding NarL/FixJ family response regulator